MLRMVAMRSFGRFALVASRVVYLIPPWHRRKQCFRLALLHADVGSAASPDQGNGRMVPRRITNNMQRSTYVSTDGVGIGVDLKHIPKIVMDTGGQTCLLRENKTVGILESCGPPECGSVDRMGR